MTSSDDLRYKAYKEEEYKRFEGVCRCCGECCGSQDGDPCANLAKDSVTDRYFCRIYEDRLGPQKTVSGRIFNCVPIRSVAKHGVLRANCAYNKKI